MKKTINHRTVAGNHEELIGKNVVIDGWNCRIIDTTETDSGKVYVAVAADAVPALYLENTWHLYKA